MAIHSSDGLSGSVKEPTLTEALHAAGFGHRKHTDKRREGRVIFHLATGEAVARDERGDEQCFSAKAGWEFLAELGGVA